MGLFSTVHGVVSYLFDFCVLISLKESPFSSCLSLSALWAIFFHHLLKNCTQYREGQEITEHNAQQITAKLLCDSMNFIRCINDVMTGYYS